MVIVGAEFKAMSGSVTAPVPASSGIDADQTTLLFPVVPVHGEERSAGPAAFGFGSPFGAGLEFEWFGAAGDSGGPGNFPVEPERFGEILADAGEDGVTNVVESWSVRIGEEEFVADMAADVRVSESPGGIVFAPGAGESSAVVGAFEHRTGLIRKDSSEDSPIEVELKSLRIITTDATISEQTDAPPECRVHELPLAD